jgi:protein required for attachment to host cells
MNVWILVANSSEAHIYSIPSMITLDDHTDLKAFESFYHPESRERSGDIASDRSGNFKHGGGGGSFVEASDPKDYEVVKFAKQVADFVNQEHAANKYDDLVIAAPPGFYGNLKQNFSNQVSSALSKYIDKDYVNDEPRQLAVHLSSYY